MSKGRVLWYDPVKGHLLSVIWLSVADSVSIEFCSSFRNFLQKHLFYWFFYCRIELEGTSWNASYSTTKFNYSVKVPFYAVSELTNQMREAKSRYGKQLWEEGRTDTHNLLSSHHQHASPQTSNIMFIHVFKICKLILLERHMTRLDCQAQPRNHMYGVREKRPRNRGARHTAVSDVLRGVFHAVSDLPKNICVRLRFIAKFQVC